MNQKLQNIDISDLNLLKNDINNGARFIMFNYRIGLGLVSLLRFSPAIFIKRENEIPNFRKKYNRINLIFGPWFLFKGPFLTYNAYKINKNGGIDITKDIMVNLTQESLLKKEVEINKVHNIFSKVSSSNKKIIIKAIKRTNLNLVPLNRVYLGLFINVGEYEEPYFVIGIMLRNDSELDTEHIELNLRKYFYKHVDFEIINLDCHSEFGKKLIEQGELIHGI
ncbi:hypothetical protein [Psychroserpens ponticola]|uniref:Uncharacterized protein n=1 Tax=Psychroserpens ponticola TaxID=2932268 RepID=A0ABY7S2M7_9FLAO|nr:hypothetical protein [Psychroserpens ponticola]WCO03532.1 hypothetical protein MUN68_008490 [Psychroserpens ponticola]